MKRLLSIIMAVLLLTALAACGSNSQTETEGKPQAETEGKPQAETEETPAVTEEHKESAESASTAESESVSADTGADSEVSSESASEDTNSADDDAAIHSDILVAYFSATGTTKGVAERIATVTGGDLYEILAADPYTADDLNYNDRSSRSTSEQNDKNARPEIGSEDISLEGYTTIYLGFPIWWGEEPRILDTFVEKYSFEGITVIPFCTSGGSGIGRSGPNMEALAGTGTWLEGKRFSGSVSEEDLKSWIDGLK